MMGEWQPITDVPPEGIVSMRGRFGKSGALLLFPEAMCVGFEWFARGQEGYFRSIRGTLPFVPLEWRRLERMRLEEA